VDAVDAGQLAQVRTLAADDGDLRLIDLVETQHVTVGLEGVGGRLRSHLVASSVAPARQPTASIHSTLGVLAASPHP